MMVRYQCHADDRLRNILIDCGKTFYQQAITWCTAYQLRQLDAIFLTHNHADAVSLYSYCNGTST
jgi:phosphoribosyl 1,2-cyclic phosphodiesterase